MVRRRRASSRKKQREKREAKDSQNVSACKHGFLDQHKAHLPKMSYGGVDPRMDCTDAGIL